MIAPPTAKTEIAAGSGTAGGPESRSRDGEDGKFWKFPMALAWAASSRARAKAAAWRNSGLLDPRRSLP